LQDDLKAENEYKDGESSLYTFYDQFRIQSQAFVNARPLNNCPEVKTLYDNFQCGFKISTDRNCIAHRPYNKISKRYGGYVWQTYRQVAERMTNFGSGLLHLSETVVKNPKVKQWCVGIHSNNRPVPIVVAGANRIPELIRIAPKVPVMKVIISMDEFDDSAPAPAPIDSVTTGKILKAWARDNGILLLDFNEVEKLGQQHPRRHNPPSPSDLAFICYTSGTTGTPKGAMLTHSNCIGVRNGFDFAWEVFPNDLAHVLELVAEMLMITGGASIGYFRGDVLNLIDDIAELKPTVFPSVPRLLTRVHAKLQQNTVYAPGIKGALSRRAIAAKLQNLEDGKGYTHAFWDRIIFNKIKQVLGGRVRVILTGSAPIGPEILQFLRVAFACDVVEVYGCMGALVYGCMSVWVYGRMGVWVMSVWLHECMGVWVYGCYGQTEGVAVATITLKGENKAGHVGDVPEMNYYSTDKPYPRGELCYRGPNIFVGYYKDDAKTKETIDSEGWLHSGDVAYVNERGAFGIIDRKKNIFKLSHGEYVAPEKLENEYVNSNLILQIFVHGDSIRNYLVAVVVPDPETFVPWANALTNQNVSLGDEKGLEILVNDKTVKSAFLEHMNEIAKQSKLKGFEIVKAIHLSGVPFSIENNLLTPTLKLKRHEAQKHFRNILDKLYAETGNESIINKINSKL
ncbi:9473_t:CDS:10, partial [Racocetra persica]